MILGFTGTRRGMTPAQRAALRGVVAVYPAVLLHGGAPGADEEADAFFAVGCTGTAIEVYPSSAALAAVWRRRTDGPRLVHDPASPLVRNRTIVARCDHLLATPAEEHEVLRSGTWATIRYARKTGKPVTLIMPNGRVVYERLVAVGSKTEVPWG